MLVVTGTVEVEAPCIVEVDPYVALSFKTYPEVLPGARYFRIGNFDTSLLEIGIDPSLFAIRSVCLVSFDKVLARDQTCEQLGVQEVLGLPMVSLASLPGNRIDEQCDFGVCLCDDSFVIDWSQGEIQ